MDKVLVVGGCDEHHREVNSCLELDTVNVIYKSVMNMHVARKSPAYAVFEQKTVVSGGFSDQPDDLNAVESYDHASDSWSHMPRMIHGRSSHQTVPIRNKLYVFGGDVDNCEVFDSLSNKFSVLKHPSSFQMDEYEIQGAISIGRKIIVFKTSSLAVFDLDKKRWSKEPFEFTEEFDWSHCIKVPKV